MPFPAAEITELQGFPTEILPEFNIALFRGMSRSWAGSSRNMHGH